MVPVQACSIRERWVSGCLLGWTTIFYDWRGRPKCDRSGRSGTRLEQEGRNPRRPAKRFDFQAKLWKSLPAANFDVPRFQGLLANRKSRGKLAHTEFNLLLLPR